MAQAPFAAGTWPTTASAQRVTIPAGSDLMALVASYNLLLTALSRVLSIFGGVDTAVTTSTLSRGTTVTLAASASWIAINGVVGSVAAETAKAFGGLGTIPTATWGLIVVERIANATTSFVSAAANYSTGYATEALAIAAMPAQSADKAVVGYLTILAASPGWVAGTDALAGGTGGTPATTTNYYSIPGAADTLTFASVPQIANAQGTVITTTAG